MGTVGVALIGVGAIIAIVALLSRRSNVGNPDWWSNLQEHAPGSAARANSGAAVAVRGTAVAPDTGDGPLREPVSGQSCVWWRCVGAAHWQERVPDTSTIDGEQRETPRWEARSSQLARSESATPFELTDESGTIWVSPRDVRAEDVSRSASRHEAVPTDGFLLSIGPISFTADEDESRRGYYMDHVSEYIPAGVELLVSGRVHRGPNGAAISPDSEYGLQLCSSDFAAEQRELEVAVARTPRVATLAAAAVALAGAAVVMLS